MFEEQPKRRQRNPLSAEELHYFKKLKQLKQDEKITAFKQSNFYKRFNLANILLSALLAYYVFSVLFVCCWQSERVTLVHVTRGEYNEEVKERTISELDIETQTGNRFSVITNSFFKVPKINDTIYIGTDFLFNKHIKTKFSSDNRAFWNVNTYPSFTLCLVALILALFIYKLNRHITHNGLLTAFGLFALASLYFILV